jgi:non-ribosomal peptide synthase protein (TIGR01720 family)
VLLGDLETACGQLSAREKVSLPAKTSSIRQWAAALEDCSGSPQVLDSLPYWRRQAQPAAGILAGPVPGAALQSSGAAVCSVALEAPETGKLIHDVPRAYGVQVPDVLVTALLRTVLPWSGNTELQLDVESHGREATIGRIDPMRTVAWFTSIYPLCLRPGPSGDAGEDLRRVKQQLREPPLRGLAYDLLRYPAQAGPAAGELADLPAAQVLFNYMGQWERTLAAGSGFSFVEPIRAFRGARGRRSHPWEINAVVFDERLIIDWTYSPRLHGDGVVEQLAQQLVHKLVELINYCLSTEDSGLTPSDFPAAGLSQAELDEVLAEFGQSGGGDRG